MDIRIRFKNTIFPLIFLLFFAPNAYACNCSAASLLGTQVNVKLGGVGGTAVNKTVNVTSGVELPKVNASSGSGFIPNSNSHNWDIDIQAKSIIIKFNHSNGQNQNYGQGNSLTFRNISPQLPAGNCTPKIVGMNAISNRPGGAPWVNTKSIFSDDYVTIFYSKNGSPVTNWVNGQWIRVDLTFGCDQVKKGMTWGFAGLSDTWPNGVVQNCSHGINRLACETYPVSSPQSNYCNSPYPYSTPNTSVWETTTVDDATQKCDPVDGDTACSKEKHVLCIAEDNNPYYNRLPPYHIQSAVQSEYWPGNITFPYDRPRYKIHAAPINGHAEYSEGWVGQFVKLSRHKKKGSDLSIAAGDAACGVGWRMASSDDGQWVPGMGLGAAYGNSWPSAGPKQSGGLAFHAPYAPDANFGWGHHGDSGMNAWWRFINERYWVKSNQGGNCWSP